LNSSNEQQETQSFPTSEISYQILVVFRSLFH